MWQPEQVLGSLVCLHRNKEGRVHHYFRSLMIVPESSLSILQPLQKWQLSELCPLNQYLGESPGLHNCVCEGQT